MNPPETLSDKYEDQYKRLEKAMIELFKYDNLLNNEYLVRKFESDDMKPDWYLLQYVVVQRENSIKNQYVQNEQNNRKQYHLILTAILKEYNKQLWNFDPNQLLIRPYFPSERKRIQIKLPALNVQPFTDTLSKAGFVKEQIIYEQEVYQADKTFIKLTLTCQSESYADEIFTWLMTRKVELHLDSVMMQNVDYLEEFHKQINQRKCAMLQNKKSEFQQPFQEEHDPDYDRPYQRPRGGGRGGRGRGGYRNEEGGERTEYQYKNNDKFERGDRNDKYERNDRDRNDRGMRGNDRRGGNRGNNQYIQKNEYNQQQQQQQYHLVPKTVLQRTPKQTVKANTLNTNDFPALDAQQS